MLKIPELPQRVIETMKKAGYEAYAVGGAVRDLFLGKNPLNWDFTTNATPEKILKIFPEGFYDNVFGTVGIQVKKIAGQLGIKVSEELEEEVVEITTYRTEHQYHDRRRPSKVEWGKSLEEDLERRDFTINAIAFDGKKIVDPFNGQTDIKNKVIRAVGNPDERFKEDALRLIRAIRIACETGFLIEKKTSEAIKKDAALIKEIAQERIRDEFLRIISGQFASDGILLMKSLGLLIYILPELEDCFGIPQQSPERHHLYDVGTHSVESLRHSPSKDPITRLATLLHDIGKAKTFNKDEKTGLITFFNHELIGTNLVNQIAERLRLPKKEKQKLVRLVRWHQFSMDEKQTDKAIRRFIRRVGKENLQEMLDLRVGDRLGGGAKESSWRFELFRKRLEEVQKQPFTVCDLKIDGHDVMQILKIKPSRKVGEVLNNLFEKVENNEILNEREVLVEEIKKQG